MTAKLGRLVTFGYAGLGSARDLSRLLADADVDVIYDVRLTRWSGNRAFSTGVRSTVESAGFKYVPCDALGNLRHRSGGIEIKSIEAIQSVLGEIRDGRTVALMCACAEAGQCHRSVLVDEAIRREPRLTVDHLAPATTRIPTGPGRLT
jgi:uncharacterized protein (DUF488 family)